LAFDTNGKSLRRNVATFTTLLPKDENQRSYYREHLEIHCYDVTLSDIMEKVLGVLAG